MDTSFLVTIILIFTYFSAYFSAAEIALFSLPSMKIKSYQVDADKRKQLIAKLVLHPRDLLVTVFMLNTLVNILIQNMTSHLFGSLSGWGLRVGVPLVLTLVLGEILPKNIALQNNLLIAYKVAPSINFLQNLLAPLRKWIVAVTDPISRVLFFFLKKEEPITREELEHMLEDSQKNGILQPDEAELVQGYLDLQEAQVNELMCPRAEMIFFDIEEPLSKLIYLIVDQKCSRVPVCSGSMENVLGIITAYQFFLHSPTLVSSSDLIPLLTKPFFVPETTPARLLLRRFDQKNEVMAIVVDEYGSVSGLITHEDLIEVVVGQIIDKRDQHALYTKAGTHVIIASGKLELSDFAEIFQVDELPNPGNKMTVGGWLIDQLGDIPKSGAKYESQGFLFHVLSADPNRVRRLYIRKLTPN